ncbi:MAG TPA: hypothetical protein VN154_02450 [Rhizomicrobium sp.]|nr:hypothetical protein [Rhizomicrobium sp.]
MAKQGERHGPVHTLDAASVTATLERLSARIAERFPQSGLSRVCNDLVVTAKATARRVANLSRPYLGLQFLVLLTLVALVCAQVYVAGLIDWRSIHLHQDIVNLTQGLDAMVNLVLLAGGAIWFLVTAEQRLKRRRTLRALFELRSFAHVIDMHQLTKDPTIVLGGGMPTAASPERRMSQFELSRYLEYCSEMLALISKLAALYAGATHDETIISAVNEMEELTSDLGRKIWQKIMILSQLDERAAGKV